MLAGSQGMVDMNAGMNKGISLNGLNAGSQASVTHNSSAVSNNMSVSTGSRPKLSVVIPNSRGQPQGVSMGVLCTGVVCACITFVHFACAIYMICRPFR